MATLIQTGQTSSSVTVTCSGLDPAHRFTRYFWWQIYLNGTKIAEYGDSLAPYSSSHTGSFTGLSASTTYGIKCGIYNDASYTELLALLECSASTSAPPSTKVQGTIRRYYDGTMTAEYGPLDFVVGSTYVVADWMPPYASQYTLDHVEKDGVRITAASFTVPNVNFVVDYFFVSSTNAYIYNGSTWVPATPYIWNGSTWVPAKANIYSGGWQS